MRTKHYSILVLTLLLTFFSYSQITTYPNFTDFESEVLCGTSCTGSCNPVGTWRNADQFGFAQAGTDWLVEDGSTPSTDTGPDIDHTTGTATGRYMYVETSGCNSVTAHLVSDVYDFTSLSTPKIEFYYHMYGATMGTMHFDVDTTGLGNWVLDVVPSWTSNQNVWQLKSINLFAFIGESNVRLRIRGNTGTSFTSDMAVDDITVFQPAASDIQVLNVEAGGGCGNSPTENVTLTWTNDGSDTIPSSTDIYFSFIDGATTVTDTFTVITPIAPGDSVAYTFVNGTIDLTGGSYVPITAYSSWVLDASFGNDTTSGSFLGVPIISNYPYYEDFEAGQNGWTINNLANGTWAFGTPTKPIISGASSGVNCFVTGGLSGYYVDTEISYVQGPCFDFSTICDPVIELKVFWNAEFSWDGMNITYSTDGGTTYQLLGAFGDPNGWYTDNTIVGNPGGFQQGWSGRNSTSNGSGTWLTAKHNMPALANLPNVKIRINFGSDGSVVDEGVAFDDIHIYNSMDLGANQLICEPATLNLDASNGNGSATYLWSEGTTTSQIVIDTTGTYIVTMTDGICIVSDTIEVQSLDGNSQIDLGADIATCDSIYSIAADQWIATNYAWSTGETTPSIEIDTTGTYTLELTNACGTYNDTIYAFFAPTPIVDLGLDSVNCDVIELDALNAGASFDWSSGETTQTIIATITDSYSVTVTNTDGCFASDTINLTISSPTSYTQVFDECDGFSITVGTNTYTTTGMYFDNLTNVFGCDSSITTDLTVAAPITATITNSNAIFSVIEIGTYQWYDCNTNNPIIGETGQTFVPTSNGLYAVEITVGNCSQFSACEALTDLGITAVTADWISIYPNPTNGIVSIHTGSAVASIIEVYASTGTKVSQHIPVSETTTLDLANLSKGVYFVKVAIEGANYSYKVVIK